MPYHKFKESSVRRILSHINLEPSSVSFGSLDRNFWGWKKRDFSDSTLQFALVPLLRASVGNEHDKLLKAAIDFSISVTHKNGSCDQSYPFEGHPKTFLDIAPLFYQGLLSQNLIFDSNWKDKIRKHLMKCLEFSVQRDEDYGIISNHLAHDAFRYLEASVVLNEEKYYQKAFYEIARIEAFTSPEGWNLEYNGADPGYQTRTLSYLSRCLQILTEKYSHRRGDLLRLESLCLNSMKFLQAAILPDGTLFDAFGSRNTQLIYPSGLEFCHHYFKGEFFELVVRVRESIEQGRTLWPMDLDFDNFLRLFDDYLLADHWKKINSGGPIETQNVLVPEYTLRLWGLKKILIGEYALFIHIGYGGAFALYKGSKLVAREAGLLVRSSSGKFLGTKNTLSPAREVLPENEKLSDKIEIESDLFEATHQDLNPYKLVVLRLLNLTFLRWGWCADLFRRLVVRILISGKKSGSSMVNRRRISWEKDTITVEDHLSLPFLGAEVFSVPHLNLFHMASSRYFSAYDLQFPGLQAIVNSTTQKNTKIIRTWRLG